MISSAWRCWDVFAVDWPLTRASCSTVRGACASRSSSSSRTGLEKALPVIALASNRAALRSMPPITIFNISVAMLPKSLRLERRYPVLPRQQRTHVPCPSGRNLPRASGPRAAGRALTTAPRRRVSPR